MNPSPDLIRDLALLFAGGLISLITGITLFFLESQRGRALMRREDYRLALRYAASGSHVSLAGANLSAMDLAFVDLSGCDLRHSNLEKCHLLRANLSNAMLAYANLRGATLVEANLQNADLFGADLRAANLTDADLSQAKMLLCRLGRATMVRAKLHGAVLNGLDQLKGQIQADLSETDLSVAILDSGTTPVSLELDVAP